MSVHLQKEIMNLKKKILSLGAIVEKSVGQAVKSVEERDKNLAVKVIDSDIDIDQLEVEVEEECLKILALHQPVAVDLRFVVAVIKINDSLERIGDLAVDIAERAAFLATLDRIELPFDFSGMALKVKLMLKQSLDALVNMDSKQAYKVCVADDEVDAINREMYSQVKSRIRENLHELDPLIHALNISRHLERIGDLASNISEDVIYMTEGRIIRHKTEDYTS